MTRWAVSALDLTGSQEGRRYMDVALDKAEVTAGERATLHITRRRAHPLQLTVVGIVSTVDSVSHIWPVAVVTH